MPVALDYGTRCSVCAFVVTVLHNRYLHFKICFTMAKQKSVVKLTEWELLILETVIKAGLGA